MVGSLKGLFPVKNIKLLNFVLLVIAVLLLFNYAKGLYVAGDWDNMLYLHALDEKNVFTFMNERYHSWSYRTFSDTLAALTLKFDMFWRVGVPLTIILLCYSLVEIAVYTRNIFIPLTDKVFFTSLTITLFFILKGSLLYDVSGWLTGWYFYLLPISLGLLGISIHIKGLKSKTSVVFVSILYLCGCSTDQFMIFVLLPFCLLKYLQSKKKQDALILLVPTFYLIFMLTSPAISSRYPVEVSLWFPDYWHLNLFDKLAFGVNRLTENALNKNLLLLLFLLTGYLRLRKKTNGQLSKFEVIVISIPLLISSLTVLSSSLNHPLDYFLKGQLFDFSLLISPISYVPLFSGLLLLGSTVCLLIVISRDFKELISGPLFFILSCLSVVALGFSPTVYASQDRIVFVMQLFLIYGIIGNILVLTKKESFDN